MALRLIQITAPTDLDPEELTGPEAVVAAWRDCRADGYQVIHLAVPAEKTESITDDLEGRFGGREGFRVVLLEIEALLPRPEEEQEPEEDAVVDAKDQEPETVGSLRISREELYSDVTDGLAPSPVFLAMTVLSALVAAVGLLRDDLAVVIGAMVIAPLLRPNVALALAATLGDGELAWRATRTNAVGVVVAVGLAGLLGLALPVDPSVPALASRASLGLGSLALALAAGAAGTLAFTQGLSGAVIGVMVAVALMPPAVAFGLLLGAGRLGPAMGALLLTAGNVICINLAGIGTFLVQGVRPRAWWEAERARRATRLAAGAWLLLLAALVGVLYVSDGLSF